MEYAFYYGRVSTADQNPDRQYAEAEELGIPREHTYIDTASGMTFNREQYQALLTQLRPGDTLYIAALDRLGRSYHDTVQEYRHLTEDLAVKLVVRDMPILKCGSDDPTEKLINSIILEVLSYIGEAEYRHIKERQRAGIEAAKAKGVYTGRRPVPIDKDKFIRIMHEIEKGDRTIKSGAARLNMSPNTFLRRRREYQTHTGIFADDYIEPED